MKIEHISLAFLTFLTIFGISTMFVNHVTAQQIPELAWKCLPPPLYGRNLDIRNSEFLEGITEHEEATYLIVRMQYEDAPFFENQEGKQKYVGRFAIKLADGFCVNLNDPRQAADYIFSSRIPVVPETVGKEIALQFWQDNLNFYQGDTEKLKASLLEIDEGGQRAPIYPEDQWALKQLEIDIPIRIPDIAPMTYDGMWNDMHNIESPFNLPRINQNKSNNGELFEKERHLIQQLEKNKN